MKKVILIFAPAVFCEKWSPKLIYAEIGEYNLIKKTEG